MTSIEHTTSTAKAEFRLPDGEVIEKRITVTHPKGLPAVDIIDLLNEEAEYEMGVKLTTHHGCEVTFIGEVFDEDFGEF